MVLCMEIKDHVDFGSSCLVIKERELKEPKENIYGSFYVYSIRETMTLASRN